MDSFFDRLAKWQPQILSLLRIMAGLLFMQTGVAKILGLLPWPSGQPAAFTLIWFAGMIELIGGALVTLGLFTRPAAFICSGTMAFAYFIGHFPRGFIPLGNGGNLAILYCFVFLFLAVAGAGPWSLDARLRKSGSM